MIRLGERAPARGPVRWLHRIGPAWALVSGFASLAVLPVGGTYPASEGAVSLVGADLDASAFVPVVLVCNSALAFAWMGWAVRDAGARIACLRAGTQTLAFGVALAMAMLPLLLAAGSLDLVIVAARQDATWSLARVAAGLGLPWSEPGWLARAALPAWGVCVNPLAVALVFVAGLGAARLPPFDGLAAEAEARTALHAEGSTQRMGNAVLADAVNALVLAGVVVTLGLGAWSIPWIDEARMAAGLTRMLGTPVATLVCAVIHVASFALKTGFVLLLIRVVARRFAPVSEERMSFLCFRVLVPLSLANVFVTGFWVVVRPGLA